MRQPRPPRELHGCCMHTMLSFTCPASHMPCLAHAIATFTTKNGALVAGTNNYREPSLDLGPRSVIANEVSLSHRKVKAHLQPTDIPSHLSHYRKDGPSSKWRLQRGTWCSRGGRSRKYTILFGCLFPCYQYTVLVVVPVPVLCRQCL